MRILVSQLLWFNIRLHFTGIVDRLLSERLELCQFSSGFSVNTHLLLGQHWWTFV